MAKEYRLLIMDIATIRQIQAILKEILYVNGAGLCFQLFENKIQPYKNKCYGQHS